MAEVSAPGLDVVDHFDEACAALDRQAAAPFVEIGPNDRELLFQRVGRDRSGLVRDRVALQVGRHAHILRGPKRSDALRQIRERGGMIVADPDRAQCPYRAPAFLGHSLRESVR